MAETLVYVSKILPIIFLIILGGLLRKIGFIGQDTVSDMKKIVLNISLPAVLIMTFAEISIESKYILIIVAIFIACIITFSLGMLLGKILNKSNKYYPALFAGGETGMIGFSLFSAVYGADNIYKLAIVDFGAMVFVFFFMVNYLQKLNGKVSTIKELTLSFLKSPIIIAVATGMAISFIGVEGLKSSPVINSVFDVLELLSGLTTPLICIAIGYELKINFKKIGGPLLAAGLRLAILLGMAFIINELIIGGVLNLDKIFKFAMYTFAALPVSFVVSIYVSDDEKENKQFVLNTISISIVLCLIAFTIMNIII